MFYLGFVCTGLAYLIHLFGVSGPDVKTEYVVYLGLIMPVVSTIFSILFLNEVLTNRIFIGGLLVICSVVIVQIQWKKPRKNLPEAFVITEIHE